MVLFRSTVRDSAARQLEDRVYVLSRSGKNSNFVVVESNGKFGLIDAGSANFSKDFELDKTFLKALGIKRFEWVFLSHLDGDHTNYIDENIPDLQGERNAWVLNQYEIGRVILKDQGRSYGVNVKNTYLNLVSTLNSKGIPHGFEESFRLGDFAFQVYNQDPPSENELNIYKKQMASGQSITIDQNLESLGLVAEKDGYKMYFAGDVILWDEVKTSKEVGAVDVLLVGHHGNVDGYSQEGLSYLQPEVAIVSGSQEELNRKVTYQDETFIVKNRLFRYLGSSDVYISGIDGTTTVDFTRTEKGIQVFTNQRISNIVHGDNQDAASSQE
ncbi:MBL fold metallo-hydrolase [Streptococcus ferus]|uniref:MBL fold metallo-hydrolase n=1 Tax=Streptococcus ferus TaxID=1345 RepID=UPI0035133FC9